MLRRIENNTEYLILQKWGSITCSRTYKKMQLTEEEKWKFHSHFKYVVGEGKINDEGISYRILQDTNKKYMEVEEYENNLLCSLLRYRSIYKKISSSDS